MFVALTAAQAVIYLLAKHAGLTVNAQSACILTVLVFGAGTDYALLLIARYREELRRHDDRHEAMAVALHRAGPAIIASAATVILSMLTLLVAELNSTKGLGPVAAIGVAVGLLAMITLLPALLVIFGRWLFWPVRPDGAAPPSRPSGACGRGSGSASPAGPGSSGSSPRSCWAALALGLIQLEANGLQSKDSFRDRPRVGRRRGGAGPSLPGRRRRPGRGHRQGRGRRGSCRRPCRAPRGSRRSPARWCEDGYAYVEGTLTSAPDSQAGYDTVERLRASVHAIPGADAKVGGGTAINLDIQRPPATTAT